MIQYSPDSPTSFLGLMSLAQKKLGKRGLSPIVHDPATGRYITADPIGLEGGMNLYAYVENNPVNFVDPEGLFSWGVGGTIGPGTISWDSSNPTSNTLSLATNLGIGGAFTLKNQGTQYYFLLN